VLLSFVEIIISFVYVYMRVFITKSVLYNFALDAGPGCVFCKRIV